MKKKSELLEISTIFKSEKAQANITPLQTEEEGYNMSLIYELLDMIVHKQVLFFSNNLCNYFIYK